MNRRWLPIIGLGLFIVWVVSIFLYIIYINRIEKARLESRCYPQSGDFSESILVGNWVAGALDHTDTLLIRSNRTYKQIIHAELANGSIINYESEWQPWYLEYSEDEIPYLHLIGMRFCGVNSGLSCEQRDSDGYDFCKDEYISMNGEGILIILETEDTNVYYLHYPFGSMNSYTYELQIP